MVNSCARLFTGIFAFSSISVALEPSSTYSFRLLYIVLRRCLKHARTNSKKSRISSLLASLSFLANWMITLSTAGEGLKDLPGTVNKRAQELTIDELKQIHEVMK